jgi:hypothetical protein
MLEARKQAGTGRWRKLDNKELHNSYSSPYIIKSRMIWVGHIACIWENLGRKAAAWMT